MCQSRRGNVCDSPGRRSSSDMAALAKASAPAKALAVVGLVAVQMVFSTYAILGKELMEGGLNPIAFALLRELGSSVVYLIAISALHPRRGGGWPRRRDLRRFALCGCCMFGNVFLGIVGLDLTTAALVSLLQPTQPVISRAELSSPGRQRENRRWPSGASLLGRASTRAASRCTADAP